MRHVRLPRRSPALGSRVYELVGVLLLTTLVACGADRPAASAGEAALRAAIDNGKATRLQLTRFSKTDGQVGELMGVKMYNMAFMASAEFVSDAMFSIGTPLGNQRPVST